PCSHWSTQPSWLTRRSETGVLSESQGVPERGDSNPKLRLHNCAVNRPVCLICPATANLSSGYFAATSSLISRPNPGASRCHTNIPCESLPSQETDHAPEAGK